MRSTRATWAPIRQLASPRPARRSPSPTSKRTSRPGTSRSRSTIAGRPGHDPSAQQLRASSRSNCSASSRDPGSTRPAAFGPDGVTDATGSTPASRRPSSRWPIAIGTSPTRRSARCRCDLLLDPAHLADLAGRIDPERAAVPTGRHEPDRWWRHDLPRRRRRRRATPSASSSRTISASGPVSWTRRPASTTRTGARTSAWTRTIPTCWSRASGRSTRCSPGCCSGTRRRPRITARGSWSGSMGGDAQPQIHAQIVSAVVDGGRRRPHRGRGSALVRGTVRPFPARRRDVHLEPRHGPGVAPSTRGSGHHLVPTGPFDDDLGHDHAIELVDGGTAAPDGGSLAAATDPRSAGLPAIW